MGLRIAVQSDGYILKKYQGCPPSLVVHFHPTHFRFDQQDGTFTYKSPMKIFVEHLRAGTVPHDLVDEFLDGGVTFYEGCLIVEVHDHKSMVAKAEKNQGVKPVERSEPFSIHHSTPYLTPSSWIPHKTSTESQDKAPDIKEGEDGAASDKENLNAPNEASEPQRTKDRKLAKITTVVLHPTALCRHLDMVHKLTTPVSTVNNGARRESRVDFGGLPMSGSLGSITPMLGMPSTPQFGMEPPAKRQKRDIMELDGKSIHTAESQIVLATTPALYLDVVADADEASLLLQALAHPEHSAVAPAPKARKKTVAEMAAEESAAADEEKFMLTLDERLSANAGAPGGANVADGEGQTGTIWEPRFEKFKALENIKIAWVEKKRLEGINKQKQAERQAAEAAEKERRRLEEAQRMKADEEVRQTQLSKQHAQSQAMQRMQMAQHAAMQRNMNGQNVQMGPGQAGHGHPQQSGALPNGFTPQHQRLMASQQAAQLGAGQAASSPVVRNSTPHNLSSPMVAATLGVPMQQSNSGMGGSPPRPGSVVQPMNPAMAQAMAAQRSQQSHSGTPRMQNSTPNLQQAVPRQLNQTPRMNQASPLPGQLQTPHMPAGMMNNAQMMGNMQIPNMQHQAALAAQQQQLRAQAAQQAGMGTSPNLQQLTPQQQQQFMAMQRQQQMQQMARQQGGGSQLAANYAAMMAQMANQQQGMHTNAQFVNQNGMPNLQGMQGMTPQMMQQLQLQQQQQQQSQQPNNVQVQQQFMQQQQQQQAQQSQMIKHWTQQASQQKFQQLMANAQQQFNGPVPQEVIQGFRRQASQQGQLEARAKFQMWQQQQGALQQRQRQMTMQAMHGQQQMQ